MVRGSILVEYDVEQCGYEAGYEEDCYNEYMHTEIKFVVLADVIRI